MYIHNYNCTHTHTHTHTWITLSLSLGLSLSVWLSLSRARSLSQARGAAPGSSAALRALCAGTHFTCFTGTKVCCTDEKVQMNWAALRALCAGTHFTCFTGTKVLMNLAQQHWERSVPWVCGQPSFSDVCWRMQRVCGQLAFSDVCWRMLTYADVCSECVANSISPYGSSAPAACVCRQVYTRCSCCSSVAALYMLQLQESYNIRKCTCIDVQVCLYICSFSSISISISISIDIYLYI